MEQDGQGRERQLPPSLTGPQGNLLALQRVAGNRAVSESIGHDLPEHSQDVLLSAGKPLDADTRAEMEARLGEDLGNVRVHTDSRAADSASSIDAHAYTTGPAIVFGDGQYAPRTDAGQRLLAHELAHVVQQQRASSRSSLQLIADASQPDEIEADKAANQAVNPVSEGPISLATAPSAAIQRQKKPGAASTEPSWQDDPIARELLSRFPWLNRFSNREEIISAFSERIRLTSKSAELTAKLRALPSPGTTIISEEKRKRRQRRRPLERKIGRIAAQIGKLEANIQVDPLELVHDGFLSVSGEPERAGRKAFIAELTKYRVSVGIWHHGVGDFEFGVAAFIGGMNVRMQDDGLYLSGVFRPGPVYVSGLALEKAYLDAKLRKARELAPETFREIDRERARRAAESEQEKTGLMARQGPTEEESLEELIADYKDWYESSRRHIAAGVAAQDPRDPENIAWGVAGLGFGRIVKAAIGAEEVAETARDVGRLSETAKEARRARIIQRSEARRLQKKYKGRVKVKRPYPPETWDYIEQLEQKYPAILKAELRPIRRPRIADKWVRNERMQTSQGNYSFEGKLRDGGKIQIDDITPDGWMIEVKYRDRGTWESEFKIRRQMEKQSEFAQENGLQGVRWEVNNADTLQQIEEIMSEIKVKNIYPVLVP